ncbi:TPR repeat-containing protein YrrB [Lachnospiraceae bacterium]|nr:TPR repeat-containing protein YrrB [Lachnospiraceae bacterium]
MKQVIENYRIISTNHFVTTVCEGRRNSERFCFIIGAGASVSSGIPMGVTLEAEWMEEMEKSPGFSEVREFAETLRKAGRLEHDFSEIEQAWEAAKKSKQALPSEYYFDIYKLRFFPNHRNGYYYLERVMAHKNPSFGYHPLALMLTEGSGSNLVITTNFDSLVEDALFLYTDSKPLVINHELLADYAGDPNIKRPIIAKIHRGIFFDPLNQPEETNELKGGWHDVLAHVFQNYTPIVIGYGGGDNSLMNLLEEESVKMKNGMYWCYVEEFGLPSEKIQRLVQKKDGHFVRTAGFDSTMLMLGNALFPEKIGVHQTEQYLNNRTGIQIENYEAEYKKLLEYEESREKENASTQTNQSENEFRKEIEKMSERNSASESERQKQNQMTAWDYWRQGERYYKLQQYGEALQSLSKAICEQSNTAQFYNSRGNIYDKLGDYENAILDYDKAIELNPEYSIAYRNRGRIYKILDNYKKAMSDYDKAIELNPEYSAAFNSRGIIYDEWKDYDRAIANYNKALEFTPNYCAAFNNRGNVYDELGDYEKALSDYNKAIEINSEYSLAYNNRGLIYGKLGDYEKAVSDYNKAMELDPTFIIPYKNCGKLHKRNGDYEKAIDMFTKAIHLDPNNKNIYLERAEVYRLMGEEKKADADEKKAESL